MGRCQRWLCSSNRSPRIQAGFHCIGLGSSIINRGFLAAVYLVPPVGHTGRIIRGNGCGKNRGLFGGVAVFGVVMARYGCRDTLDGGFLNSITIKYIAGAQQGVLISDSGNFAVGAAGELNGIAANFQLSNSTIPCYGKLAACYFQFIYGYSSQIKRYLCILSTVSHALLVPNWIYRY